MAASGDDLLLNACDGACQATQPDGWGGSRRKNGVPGLSDGSEMLVVHADAVIGPRRVCGGRAKPMLLLRTCLYLYAQMTLVASVGPLGIA